MFLAKLLPWRRSLETAAFDAPFSVAAISERPILESRPGSIKKTIHPKEIFMNNTKSAFALLSLGLASLVVNVRAADDWPQWRGPNRDAKAPSFTVPKSWPKELTQKWKVEVGDGVATPSLVGDKLYIFSRQEGGEIIRCLNTSDGKELWKEKYDSLGATGSASGFPGPRATPTVADGKAVTLASVEFFLA